MLRTCPSRAGVIRTPKKVAEILGSQIQPGTALSAVPQVHTLDTTLTEGMTCSHSTVVASHPSSPVSSTEGEALSGEAETLAHSARVEETLVSSTEVISNNNIKNIVQTTTENHESDTSLLSEISEADDNDNLWTTVAHRRSRSLDSLKRNTKISNKVMIAQN